MIQVYTIAFLLLTLPITDTKRQLSALYHRMVRNKLTGTLRRFVNITFQDKSIDINIPVAAKLQTCAVSVV